MAAKGIKPIAPVPTANDFLDIVLSKTQRKTPTVSHSLQGKTLQGAHNAFECIGHSQKLQNK